MLPYKGRMENAMLQKIKPFFTSLFCLIFDKNCMDSKEAAKYVMLSIEDSLAETFPSNGNLDQTKYRDEFRRGFFGNLFILYTNKYNKK
jgi:hypothetical protein